MHPFNTTIAALSTPPGQGGVALIRVSGAEAIAIVDRCFCAKSGKALTDIAPRTAVWGDIFYHGDKIDDVLVTVFPAPHSYTGEDTAEIACHGSMLICRTVLEALFTEGAVAAERGEFTRRAFLAGKLGLSEAEAIGELLSAKSYTQLQLFRQDSRSKLSRTLGDLYDRLATLISTVYAKIDYPDEDLADLTTSEIAEHAQDILADTETLMRTYRTGRAIAEGVPTVLLGKPNTGKSSLYNLLLGKDAAIVTEIAGTTRDVLEATVPLGRVLLRLSDTAGIRETDDPIEKIGVDRSRDAANEASLILALFDTSSAFDGEDAALLALLDTLQGAKIALLNKSDLPSLFDASRIASHFDAVLPFSTVQGDTALLQKTVEEMFTDADITVGEDAIVSSARQFAALEKAREHLSVAIAALQAGYAEDAALSDMELALGDMAETDGRAVSEDVVARIFSKFCVGK